MLNDVPPSPIVHLHVKCHQDFSIKCKTVALCPPWDHVQVPLSFTFPPFSVVCHPTSMNQKNLSNARDIVPSLVAVLLLSTFLCCMTRRECMLLGSRHELVIRRHSSRTLHGGLVLCCSFAVHLLPPMAAINGCSTSTILISSFSVLLSCCNISFAIPPVTSRILYYLSSGLAHVSHWRTSAAHSLINSVRFWLAITCCLAIPISARPSAIWNTERQTIHVLTHPYDIRATLATFLYESLLIHQLKTMITLRIKKVSRIQTAHDGASDINALSAL
ncbi:hypothetical protein EV424DRAFT_1389437 [Suillus variegatus]|nr:hypothetical protein EV424DRAFT_1389437 [Suillus variegatus]